MGRSDKGPWLLTALALCTASMLVLGAVSGAAAGTSGRELAREQLTTPTRTPVLGDLDPALALVARQASDPARALSFARSMGLETRSSSVRVTLRTTSPQAASAAVDAAGGAVEGTYESLVQALVPPAALAALAAQPEILRVERPATFVSAAVSGEGIRTIDAADSHAGGFNGAGVSIAVFDTGFANLLAQQDAGELPGSLTTRSFCADGFHAGGTHGTAVAEIVHEVAPAAELHLVCINTVVDLGRAKDYAIENGIDVINMSGGFYIRGDGNGTGTGTFAALPDGIAKQARDSGIVWVNAAGNEALRHWRGTLADPDGDGVLDFAAGDEGNSFTLGAGATACAYTRWQAWPGSGIAADYDLYVTNAATGAVVAKSEDGGPTVDPIEELCFANGGPTQAFSVALVHRAGSSSLPIDLFVSGVRELEHADPRGGLFEPAASSSVVTVGAVCWRTGALQPYSSRGPNGRGELKPDVVGPSAVSNGIYGASSDCQTGFAGTSAATPHVAGLVALLKQRHPGHGVGQLTALVRRLADDLGAPGGDTDYGVGLVRSWSDPPQVYDSSASRGADGVATVSARVSSPSQSEYRWEYGSTPALGNSTGTAFFVGNPEPSGGAVEPLRASHRLDFAGTVYARLVAKNAFGTTLGPTELVPTLLDRPSVATLRPRFASASEAEVGAAASANGVTARYGVEYGPTAAYGTRVLGPLRALDYVDTASSIVRLEPGRTYHLRAIAVDAGAR